ncbi:hypothetical protein [Tolypothrix sp. VBCCA 56010]|uniref:hypothetical protein n=1 Tax=Tolypothrix sp. VBCCA 56010 TaxID=3137731 RepID=UPI003D7E35E1
MRALTWAAKAIGTGALSAFGSWGFNRVAARASAPQPAKQPQKNFVFSLFSSQKGYIYAWNPSSGWYFYNQNSRFQPIPQPEELLHRDYDVFQLSNGGYQQERPSGNYGYDPRINAWIIFSS